ncbi:flagellar hook-length control protein FliK [Geobacter sp. AOG2]|uniref:flagellar hook-length control protein FliK n=1 Tax=Geobacter sp. AOG2 TaxID=1566347 RepID=UPI001CC4BA46|nr:flagellar hook-length control protein FliK [Geobacter sp. AOG2]GFE59486.1 hypothetical protein AOG2_00740 [Geobacter sp. AOG2]
MDTGQMSMMPANVGVATPGSAQLSSSATALPDSGDQAGGLFVGLLAAMTPLSTPQGAAVPVSGDKDAPVPEKSAEAAATAAQQDGLSGLMAGLLNALDAVEKSPATETEARAAAQTPGKKPQDVALNADGLQMALPIQADSGRTPQINDEVEQQASQGPDEQSASAAGDGAEDPAPVAASDRKPQDVGLDAGGMLMAQMLQVTGGRMPQANGAGAQQAVDAPAADGAVTALANKGGTDALSKGASADSATLGAVESQQQASATAGQKNQAVGSDMVSTERGKTPSDRKGSAGAPVSPSGGDVKVQSQQEVTLFRSAPLEVALAESVPQNEVRTTGQTQNVSSAQNTPVDGITAASTEKTPPLQQDIRPVKAGSIPVPAAPSQASAPQPEQAAVPNDRTLEATKSVQAAVVPAAEKAGAEAGGETVQTRPESAVTAKPVQNVAIDAAKLAGAGSSGGEFSAGDDKGTADSFMNGQFHTTLMHQQGNVDGASATGTVAAPLQGSAQPSGLSEQILQQVKDRLAGHEIKTGSDQIVLRLSPENLGELKVNLTMDGQRLKVEIVAQNHMVRDSLLQNSDSLKESLARQNISMDSFSVTTDGRGAGNPGQGQQQNGWREFAQQQQQNAWMSSGGYRLPEVTTVPSQLAYQTPSSHTMVDLHF